MRAVAALVQFGSVTQAAAHLRVSQPAVSRTIRQLEEELSLDLFKIVSGRLVPTPHANALLPGINRVLGQIDGLARHAEDLRDGKRGVLRIASAPSSVTAVVEAGYKEFTQAAPYASLDIVTARTTGVVDLVAKGDVELGFCQLHGMENNIVNHISFPGSVVCVLREDHPLAAKPEISVSDLAHEPLITFSEAELTGRRIMMAFTRAGIRPNCALQIGQTLPAINLVATGAGIALVDSFFAESFSGTKWLRMPENYQHLIVLPFHPIIHLSVQMLTSASRPLSYLAEVFIDSVLAKYSQNR